MNFTFVDAIIVVTYLLFTIYLGLKGKKYVEDSDGYFIASRKIKLALGLATLIATEIGTVTFMYMAEFGFTMGFSSFFIGLLNMVGFVFLGSTGFIVSSLRKLKIVTIPEFYEIKYNKNVRLLGGIILFLSGILNMGIFLKFDAIFLSETMGLGQDVLTIIMVILLIVVIGYTIFGGMLSVVITDFMQFTIIAISMIVITVMVFKVVSFSDISHAVNINHGDGGLNPLKNLKLGWYFVGWTVIATFTTGALHQPIAAKAFCSDSPKTAKRLFLFFGLTLAGRSMIPMLWGIAALAYFGPNVGGIVGMPKLIGAIVPSGWLGIIVAGMLAASMSTYSAYLLSWSSVATRDIIGPLRKTPLSDEASMKIAKIFSLFVGIFILVFGLVYKLPSTAFQYLILTGSMYVSGAFAAVAGGLYWKKANNYGAYSALAVGIIMPGLFLILSNFQSSLPPYLLFLTDVNISGFVGMILPVIAMFVGSMLTQKSCPPNDITKKLKEA